MKKASLFVVVVLLFSISISTNAGKFNTATCIGIEDASHGSKMWKIVWDLRGEKLIVNGDVLDIDFYGQKIHQFTQ